MKRTNSSMRQLQVIMESAQNGTDFFDAEYLERLL